MKNHGRYIKINTEELKYITIKVTIISYRNIAREEERNKWTAKQTKQKMAIVNAFLSIITLHVNGLNSPIKWYRLDTWI